MAACQLPFVALLGTLCLTGCKYDDDELWAQVNDNTARIQALEEWQQTANNNISALQQLLSTTDYITAVTPVMQGDVEIGYTITFLHSSPITIYHGTDGIDGAAGATPEIGITQEADDNWYWTLNGSLLLDADGNPIRANGRDGQDGEDGQDGADGEDGQDGTDGSNGTNAPAPVLAVGSSLTGISTDAQGNAIEPTAVYLSVDGRRTWYRVSGSDGTSSSTFFSNVEDKGEYVEFTWSAGGSFRVPKYQEVALTFSLGNTPIDDLSQPINIITNAFLSYVLTGSTGQVSVRILEGEGWSASLGDDNVIIITCGASSATATLEVVLTENGEVLKIYRLILKNGLTGSGTAEDPYLITSIEDLQHVAEKLNEENRYQSDHFRLERDIICTEAWTPIGLDSESATGDRPFNGTFDGAGHTITLADIAVTGRQQGLFASIGENGVVKDLTVNDSNLTLKSGAEYVGCITGENSGRIENCHVKGKITATNQSNMNVGGIAGQNRGVIVGCTSACNIQNTNAEAYSVSYLGCLVGQNFGGNVVACYATAKIEITNVNIYAIGGVVGYNSSSANIYACYYYPEGTVSSDGTSDVCGYNESKREDSFVACYSSTTTDWSAAAAAMNAAIETYNSSAAEGMKCNYQYSTTDASTPPTLVKKE